MVSRALRRARRPGREPAGGVDRQLAGDAARGAACVAAHGLSRPGFRRTRARWPSFRRSSSSAETVEALVESLEVRFLANRRSALHFGLLTDFVDAPAATLPSDAPLLELAARRIAELNEKHGADRFFLFHRPRRYNAGERAWIGFERKRGKLADLNALLRGAGDDRFSRVVGRHRPARQCQVRDHARHRHAAAARCGAAARRRNDAPAESPALRRRRTQGRGRVRNPATARRRQACPASTRSRYAKLQGGEAGIDPYTRTVSDVYQDLFGEGSFIGKGIYDVDAFEQRARQPLSRQPHPEPRPARGLLCAIGTADRHTGLRGRSRDLPGGHAPPPSLDSRRLADRELAVPARSGCCPAGRSATRFRCFRSGRSSTTCAAVASRPR